MASSDDDKLDPLPRGGLNSRLKAQLRREIDLAKALGAANRGGEIGNGPVDKETIHRRFGPLIDEVPRRPDDPMGDVFDCAVALTWAARRDGRPDLVGATRVLHALLESMYSGDAVTIRRLEVAAAACPELQLGGIAPLLAPLNSPLPPKKGPTRAAAIRNLVQVARYAIESCGGDAEQAAAHMFVAMGVFLPTEEFFAVEQHADEVVRDAYRKLTAEYRNPDPERLTVETLVAYGVDRADAWNWVRAAMKNATDM